MGSDIVEFVIRADASCVKKSTTFQNDILTQFIKNFFVLFVNYALLGFANNCFFVLVELIEAKVAFFCCEEVKPIGPEMDAGCLYSDIECLIDCHMPCIPKFDFILMPPLSILFAQHLSHR